jgi:hypothetical protein
LLLEIEVIYIFCRSIAMLRELPLPRPATKRRISVLEILNGPYIPAEKKIGLMSAAEYEDVIHEWAAEYIANKYTRVRSFAGAGDKGRDVVGYFKDGSTDIYQCKHYKDKVAPTTLYPELGKLCYYTDRGDYSSPKSYFIVAPQGCGPEVLDMIANPGTINQKLIDNWDKYCRDKITSKVEILLTDKLKQYVEKFDFSIVHDIDPSEFVKQHAQTRFHILRFGGGIKAYREIIPEPEKVIQSREQKYTESLFEVYQEACGKQIKKIEDLVDQDKYLKHFIEQRRSFYSAESLEKFSRENFPDADPLPFEELKDDADSVLQTTLELHEQESGYKKVLIASQEIKRQEFASNPLSKELKPLDKDGLCHHLVNEDRIKWMIK